MYRHTGGHQSLQQRWLVRTGLEEQSHRYVFTARSKPGRERANDGLEAPERCRRKNVQNLHCRQKL
jgi:hypothetical protein